MSGKRAAERAAGVVSALVEEGGRCGRLTQGEQDVADRRGGLASAHSALDAARSNSADGQRRLKATSMVT